MHEEMTPEDYLKTLKNDIKIDKDISHEFFTGLTGETKVLDKSTMTAKKPVVYIKENKDCVFDIGRRLTLVKLFIEDCHDCVITVNCPLSTGVIELWKCSNVVLNVNNETGTLQVDLSSDITLDFQHKKYLGSVVQAGVHNLNFVFRDSEEFNFLSGLEQLKEQYPDLDLNETHDQFITRWIKKELLTELIVRMENGYPTTDREQQEMEQNGATDENLSKFLETAAPALGIDEQAIIAKSNEAKAEQAEKNKIESSSNLKKLAATKAYVKGNYDQAVTLLSDAIELTPDNHVLYSNRAASYMALSNWDLALEDCNKCIELADDFTKGHYRKGLCLVEMGRFEEAEVALRDAYDLEPENTEIVDQLKSVRRKLEQ
eukprot:TRINITY_DN3696_c0_g1_i1.p1 TRINITY_DN3696_c0_g1~~TRINITY_DN3696_c0_g1_i1.p1  ORF type:complete len:396 (+),score=134.34 TRINITY_DN3696_c0_g1_i1:67-1188(+)